MNLSNGLPTVNGMPAINMESLDNLDLSGILAANEELHSVDDFFSSYVAELTQRSKRAGAELSIDPATKQAKVATSFSGAFQQFPALGPRPTGPAQPSPFLGGMGTSLPAGISPAMLQQAGLATMQPQQAAAYQANLAALAGIRPPGMGGGAARAVLIPTVSRPSSEDNHGSPASTEEGGAKPRGGRGGKSARQQQANKIAQQRYRERKKQKFSDMEQTVEALRLELAQLQTVAARNQILEGMNDELQRALIDREREVERLKVELDTHADASLGGGVGPSEASEGVTGAVRPSGGSEGAAGTASAAATGGFNGERASVPCDLLPRDLSGIDFKSGFADQIELLRQYITKHSLDDADPLGTSVPPEIVMELAQIVGTSCQLCQAAIRAEGARVLELIAGDPSQMSSAEHPAQDRFVAALEAMHLTPSQEEQLILLRNSHLEKMREIYAERQALNLEAMAQMLPHHSRNPAEDNTLEGRMENIAQYGYLPMAKSNAALASVLDAIKDNLRREQRSAMDINCATVSMVLTPLQAARYMVNLYPQHCDALALSNVLASRRGEAAAAAARSAAGERGGCAGGTSSGVAGAPMPCCQR